MKLTMLHKDSEGYVVGEYLSTDTSTFGIVRNAGVELGHQETGLGFVLIAHNVPRDRESAVHNHLRIGLRSLQKASEGCMFLLLVVLGLTPRCHRLSVEDNHMEECVQQQNGIRPYRRGIQHCRLGRSLE